MTLRKSGPRRRDDFRELNVSQRYELLHGLALIDALAFTDGDEMRRCWGLHRDDLRDEWQRDHPPGTRCFSEWLFELVPQYGERRTTAIWRERNEPRDSFACHGILHTELDPPAQEPECEYLLRNGIIDLEEYNAACRR